MASIEERLKEMGITLAEPPKPVASYVGFVEHGGLVFVSGQLPLESGKLMSTGHLGDNVSVEEGGAAARQCAINVLAHVKVACGGDLERIERCIKLTGFVACTADFKDHPAVINGASEFMGDALGERGAHARAAVGVSALPLQASVEVEGIFAIRK